MPNWECGDAARILNVQSFGCSMIITSFNPSITRLHSHTPELLRETALSFATSTNQSSTVFTMGGGDKIPGKSVHPLLGINVPMLNRRMSVTCCAHYALETVTDRF